MKIYKSLFFGLASICFAFSIKAQGTFENLNFESASIPSATPVNSLVPVSQALPAWSAYFTFGTTIEAPTQVGYDFISLGGSVISIIDASAPSFAPLQGQYSAFLFGGGNIGSLASASISQTGAVPAGTQSLTLDAYVFGAPFVVTLGGQTINMSPLELFPKSGSAPAYALYGGNIPASFAGLTEALTFTEPPATGVQPSEFELDNIVFSPSSVTPEPSPLALTAIGGLLFALYRRLTANGKC